MERRVKKNLIDRLLSSITNNNRKKSHGTRKMHMELHSFVQLCRPHSKIRKNYKKKKKRNMQHLAQLMEMRRFSLSYIFLPFRAVSVA